MKPFSELTNRERSIEVLRWLGVLPAAVLAHFAARFALGSVVLLASHAAWGFDDSTIAYYLKVILYYLPPKSAFVIAGAKMAPRHQRATTIALTVVGVIFSLMTHVVGQHLAGNRVGIVNYTHFVAESAGVLVGAGYILLKIGRASRDLLADPVAH
jgi:hypothetical protein